MPSHKHPPTPFGRSPAPTPVPTLLAHFILFALLSSTAAAQTANVPSQPEGLTAQEQLFRDAAAGLAEDATELRASFREQITRALVTADDHHAARLLFRMAELAERDGDIEEAVQYCGESLARDPSGRFAHRCRGRLRSLEQRAQSPEYIVFYRELDRVRRDYLSIGRDESVAIVEGLVESAPSDLTRATALEWLANEFGELRSDPDRAWAYTSLIIALDDLPPNVLHRAFNALIVHGYDSGRIAESRSDLDRFIRLYPERAQEARLEELRVYALPFGLRPKFARAATVAIAAFGLLFLLRRGWRGFRDLRDGSWKPWLQILWLVWFFVGAGLIAELWDRGFLLPFLTLIPAILAIQMLAGALGRLPAPLAVRIAQASLAAVASVGSMYLIGAAWRMHALFGL